ncbi:MAG: hypothetical protein K2W99_00570 [Chthoniobacterales bacterium]|nr:hypothetical protein [Chthoniobacterales bacterium]
MNEIHKMFPKLDKLIDSWCERRCLKPLCFILRDYPLCSELSDGWGVLLEALLEIKGICCHELTLEERRLLGELIHAIQEKKEGW